MNIVERLVAQRIHAEVEAGLEKVRIEASQSGFELGKEAQKELFLETGMLKGTEQTHSLKCPNCTHTINIPCINYTIPKSLSDKNKE